MEMRLNYGSYYRSRNTITSQFDICKMGRISLVLVKLTQRFCRIESRDGSDWKELLKLPYANANGCKVGLIPVDRV